MNKARMSTRRISADAGWQDPKTDESGRRLCRRCQAPVPKGRRSWCGEACIHEHKIRTNPGYVRQCVEERDKGVCAACGLDTGKLARLLERLCWGSSIYAAKPRPEWLRDHWAKRVAGIRTRLIASGWDYETVSGIKSMWAADHTIPVVEGGGECGLDGYRTLCVPCHKRATKELAGRRAQRSNRRLAVNAEA